MKLMGDYTNDLENVEGARVVKGKKVIRKSILLITILLLIVYSVLEAKSKVINNDSIALLGFFVDFFASAIINPINGQVSNIGGLFWVSVFTILNIIANTIVISIFALPVYLICRFIIRKSVKITTIAIVCTILFLLLMFPSAVKDYKKISNTSLQSETNKKVSKTYAPHGMSSTEEEGLYKKAEKYMKGKYPNFMPKRDRVYINKHNTKDIWYAYIFDNRDKGLGYEVYYDNGTFTDSYNEKLFSIRQELISYMNTVMPENKLYNEYVEFNPFGFNTKTLKKIGDADGFVSYGVIAKNINIKEQLKKDYLISKKATGLIGELGMEPKGISVVYVEIDNPDINNYIDKTDGEYDFIKSEMDRSSFITCCTPSSHRIKERMGILQYSFSFSKSTGKELKVLNSEEAYLEGFKRYVEISPEYVMKDKNRVLNEIY